MAGTDTGAWVGWLEPLLALLLFLAAHVLPARASLRARLVTALGELGYLLVFSALSLVLLAWLLHAVWRAPAVVLWYFAPWQSWIPLLAMPFACVLASTAVGMPNPLSFGGARPAQFDPRAPGVAGICRHPLLLALAVWAFAHLLPNGELAMVLLFGSLGLFALAGMRVLDRRRQHALGPMHWQALAAHTSNLPFLSLLRGTWHPRWRRLPWFRVALGLVGYLLLLWAHPRVFGVPALPFVV